MPLNSRSILFFLLIIFITSATSIKALDLPVAKIDTTETKTAADTTEIDSTEAEIQEEVIIFWTKKNALGVNFNEVAFVNWNAGGNNSVSAAFYGNFERNYQKELLSWKTNSTVKIGLSAQEGRELRKTEDQISINSTAGYRRDSTSNFRYSAKFNFNTQFAAGYRYPDREEPISKFMAPAYIFLGVGTEYTHPTEELTLYLSPITQKTTIVLDRKFANQGMFGVTPAKRDEDGNIIEEGEMMRTEIGVLFTSGYTKEIFTNIKLDNQVSLYSDYLNKFGNVDVDWQVNLDLVVNDYVKASIGSHLKYDDDVKVQEDTDGDGEMESIGPRIQFKQMLGVGLVYEF